MIWTWCSSLAVAGAFIVTGCAASPREGPPVERAAAMERAKAHGRLGLPPEIENRVLAIDPEHVTGQIITDTLSKTPAPRIINIHGGIYPVYLHMVSFADFLVGMGYPRASILNPADGTYTFSCYESSTKITGFIAWYYERDGLRPMIVSHSQGGFQVIKILRELAGLSSERLSVWNPLTGKKEKRHEIIDPLTGNSRPVVGLQLPFATAVGSGGLTRFMPNQWSTFGRLRTIPDSVEEFTAFSKGMDILGGDFLGYGSANENYAAGQARVRNVRLPLGYGHVAVPSTRHLLKNTALMEWVNQYQPAKGATELDRAEADVADRFKSWESRHILWAAEVWFSLKKHWVIELQRAIQAERAHAGSGEKP